MENQKNECLNSSGERSEKTIALLNGAKNTIASLSGAK